MATKTDWIAGYMEISLNGTTLSAEGSFSVVHGHPSEEALFGPDFKYQGVKASWIPPTVKGNIRKTNGIKVTDILNMSGGTMVIKLGDNSKHMFKKIGFSGEGPYDTDTGNIAFEGSAATSTEIS